MAAAVEADCCPGMFSLPALPVCVFVYLFIYFNRPWESGWSRLVNRLIDCDCARGRGYDWMTTLSASWRSVHMMRVQMLCFQQWCSHTWPWCWCCYRSDDSPDDLCLLLRDQQRSQVHHNRLGRAAHINVSYVCLQNREDRYSIIKNTLRKYPVALWKY